jgi:hypothetical protein
LKDLPRFAKRIEVYPFAVDAEASVVAEHEAPQPAAAMEHLPGDHHVEREPKLVRRLVEGKTVVVAGVVWSDENPVPLVDRLSHVIQTLHFDFK